MLESARESLTLYAKQAAWLAATPEKLEESRAARFAREDGDDPRPEAQLPDVDGAEHLGEYLFEVGPAPGGNPLTFGELRDWQECTGVELDEFEATTLAHLSRVYLSALHEARKPGAAWPARRDLTRDEQMAKARRMRRKSKA